MNQSDIQEHTCVAESCTKCKASDFEFSRHWKEYSCKICGWGTLKDLKCYRCQKILFLPSIEELEAKKNLSKSENLELEKKTGEGTSPDKNFSASDIVLCLIVGPLLCLFFTFAWTIPAYESISSGDPSNYFFPFNLLFGLAMGLIVLVGFAGILMGIFTTGIGIVAMISLLGRPIEVRPKATNGTAILGSGLAFVGWYFLMAIAMLFIASQVMQANDIANIEAIPNVVLRGIAWVWTVRDSGYRGRVPGASEVSWFRHH